jgi:hypothetical protein
MRLVSLFGLLAGVSCWPQLAAAQYRDDFEDEALGALPSHWMESETEEHWNAAPRHWRVVEAPERPGSHVLFADQMTGVRKALLHSFGSNVQLEAAFRVVRRAQHPGAQVSFILRENSDWDRVELTYRFASGLWEVRERTGVVKKLAEKQLVRNPSRLNALATAPLAEGWHQLALNLVEGNLVAVLDGQRLLEAKKLELQRYGRVGFEVRHAEVQFDDVTYMGDGEGRVHDGIKEIGGMHGEIYSDIFKSPAGAITVKSKQNGQWGVLQSTDEGETWRFASGVGLDTRDLNQVVTFGNQHILDITGKQQGGGFMYEASMSADGGAHWSPGVMLPRDPTAAYMEAGRLQLANAGRAFMVLDNARKQGTQLFYTDDEGAHWTAGQAFTPQTYPELFRRVKRFESPHVVSCGGDRVATFFRSNRDYHYRTLSDDNGLTWSDPQPVFQLRSSLSDAAYALDPKDGALYAVWMYELKRDPPGCESEGQWPRERMVLTRSNDCGATWSYLMDLENWEGNDARWNQMVLRVIGDYLWISADVHMVAATTCSGDSYSAGPEPFKNYDWRRLYRVDKRKLEPLPHMPLLLTR